MVCTDIQVMRGANGPSQGEDSLPSSEEGTSKHSATGCAHSSKGRDYRVTYQQKLTECLSEQAHDSDGSVQHKWETLKNCMVSAGEVVVGRGGNTQPDWFVDSANTVQPLLDEKNAAYDRFLQAKSQSSKNEFRRHQRIVKRAVDTAKEDWI